MSIKEKEIELETLKREIAQAEASLEQDFIKHMVDKTSEKVEDLFFSNKPEFYRFVFTEQNNYLREKLTDKVGRAMDLSDEIQRDKDAEEIEKDKEAFLKDLSAIKPTPLPKKIDTESFLNAFNGVKNKENFIKHLKNKPDAKHRLAYLHLVEPTLKEPDITLIFKEQGKEVKKEHIKAFQGDPRTIYYFLVTQDNDSKLITGLRTSENYFKAEINKADIIHSFIPQDS